MIPENLHTALKMAQQISACRVSRKRRSSIKWWDLVSMLGVSCTDPFVHSFVAAM